MRILALVLSWFMNHPGPPATCSSTIFGHHGDKWAGGDAKYLRRPVDPETDVGVAHRTLPLGSRVLLQNPRTGDLAVATVVDRGPYGAVLDDGEMPAEGQICRERADGRTWCVKTSKLDPGTWSGCLDLTPRAAKLLGHSGRQKIRYYVLHREGTEVGHERKISGKSRGNVVRAGLQDSSPESTGAAQD